MTFVAGLREPPLLEVASLSKHFGGEAALVNARMTLRRGEIRGLIGANGSGKSTFVKLLAGYHHPDPESLPIRVDGHDADPTKGGIPGFCFVHQNLALIPEMSVIDNIELRRARFSRLVRPRRTRDEEAEVAALISQYDLRFSPRTLVRELRAVDQTMVAVLRALRDPREVKLLVLDEVTARLPPPEVAEVLTVVRQLRHCGVIFVSHRMEEVIGICDTVTVLRSGRVVADVEMSETDEDALLELLTGRPAGELYPHVREPQPESTLHARRLTGGRIRELDLDVRAGEIVGVASLDPHEATGVLSLIFGLEQREAGELLLAGEPVAARAGPTELTGLGVTLVTDRLASSLPSFTVRENLTTIRLRDVFGRFWLSTRVEKRLAEELLEAFGVVPRSTEAIFELLSGGNQQKVVLARSMRLRPRLLLLDDPTRGVDVGAKTVIYALVRRAAEEGAAVLLASTDFEEMASICHRAVALRDGRVNDVVAGDALTAPRLLEGCYASRRAA